MKLSGKYPPAPCPVHFELMITLSKMAFDPELIVDVFLKCDRDKMCLLFVEGQCRGKDEPIR